ncbi:lytic transglycosylase domain-containing protein [Symbioplanes lichenis]|uniref:lytic transglycosylase domain-containing protein n=1 Tax=Symbioplanes lichenis TaxID=1629072 RepID=UPI002739F94C|nr:lytic transglycosylase domain-containing protein [Actinoplanes lichenis]
MDRRITWVAAVLALVVGAGCGMINNQEADPAAGAPVPSASAESLFPIEEVTRDTATEKPKPSKKPRPKPSEASPTPTEDPNNFQAPECAEYDGKAVSKSKAKAALTAAAAKSYWPKSAPGLKIPKRLVLATAWHESGWQSNIVNCDGGHGLMQVMPDTEAFINQRFERTYDSQDYKQNAILGVNYLAWLTKAFGDQYFDGKYDLSAARCRGESDPCLLNMVIAGYNAGRGAVDEARADKQLPNPRYVYVTRSLMESCYCDRY